MVTARHTMGMDGGPAPAPAPGPGLGPGVDRLYVLCGDLVVTTVYYTARTYHTVAPSVRRKLKIKCLILYCKEK